MGNCFPTAYKWLREKAGTRHNVPLTTPSPRFRNVRLDLEFENLMLSDETIEAAQRWFKKSRKSRADLVESPHDITPTNLTGPQSGQIIDPAIFLTSGDSNYYSWISTNDMEPADDETPTATNADGQCEIVIADYSTDHPSTSSNVPNMAAATSHSWLARFKKFRHSAADSYSRRSRHPYAQLLGTPNSDKADLEWEPEAAMLPFLSADLRWEYLNNHSVAVNEPVVIKKYGTNCSVIGGDLTNLSSKQTNVVQNREKSTKTNCSTPRSGRSSSPALEWDTDDIMDPETSELLTEIDRIAQNLNQSAWSA